MGESLSEKMARLKAEAVGTTGLTVTTIPGSTLTAPVANDNTGAMGLGELPHTVVVADGVRGNDEIQPVVDEKPKLVSDGQNVFEESDFVKELTEMHDEIERLTKEYTAGGLQVSDFPASYSLLTNRYRIRAAQLNRRVGGVGKEESKVQREIDEMNAKLQARLLEARAQDAKEAEERKK